MGGKGNRLTCVKRKSFSLPERLAQIKLIFRVFFGWKKLTKWREGLPAADSLSLVNGTNAPAQS